MRNAILLSFYFGISACVFANSRTLFFKTHAGLKNDVNSTCGYRSCNVGKPGVLNVHVVPHTHDDVGWKRTVDQYYYGWQARGVQFILDNVVQELLKNPARRFIYVEIAFFYRWWNEQDENTKDSVRMLVQQGRLEFILGGWSMNDEASTHYNAIIDQHTRGFQFLRENFGECGRPRIGWQVDPFGHSREQAALFAQFGFDGLFFGRLDYQDKAKRLRDKTMELLWMGSDDLGWQGSLFTGVNYNGYGSPHGFSFDGGSSDPIMDDNRLNDYNVEAEVMAFIKTAFEQAENYSTNHIMMTMGGDFQYENANVNFKNYDKLIEYVNEFATKNGVRINVFYSTPSCYAYAINHVGQKYTMKTDDFFPYASRAHTFWTGYFTSRPAVKGYARLASNFLQVCKQMSVLSGLGPATGTDEKVDILRRALGVVQHHDGISGTETQAVAYDYAQRLAKGITSCQDVVKDALHMMLTNDPTATSPVQQFCPLLNASNCPATEGTGNFTIILYNPIGREVTWWVRVPVSQVYQVYDSELNLVESQIVPLSDVTKKLPEYNGSVATDELVFKASLPALGFRTYFAVKGTKIQYVEVSPEYKPHGSGLGSHLIRSKYLALWFEEFSGLLIAVENLDSLVSAQINQRLSYYKGFSGDNHKDTTQSSGAYVFRPNGTTTETIGTGYTAITYINGSQVQEWRQVYSPWASQVFRMYKDERYVEVEWTVGPIAVQDNIGKEVISKFMTDVDNGAEFYTDANGRQVLKRIRNHRATWDLNQTEPIAGNYYPVNSRIYIQGAVRNVQVTVLNDRSQGGASVSDGEFELMVHRRLLHDDSFGVGEALNETGITGKGLVVRGKHYIIVDTKEKSQPLHRDLAEKIFMAPSLTFSNLDMSPEDYRKKYPTIRSLLKKPLPPNVHLLTLEWWESGTVLLRLEHFYQKEDDPALSQPATVYLRDMFVPFNVTSAEELTLGANAKIGDVTRLKWNTDSGSSDPSMTSSLVPLDPSTLRVVIKSMQIRTFQLTVAMRSAK